MKTKIIIANWKMYLGYQESGDLARVLAENIGKKIFKEKKIVVCPSNLSLASVRDILKDTPIALGIQNIFWEDTGAYTGEVCAADAKKLGCGYALLGHSERRKFFNEDNAQIHQKVKACFRAGIIPVVCVGEDSEQKRQGLRDTVLIQQLHEIFGGIKMESGKNAIIAYEPVWAISGGGGVSATLEEAEYAHQVIRHMLLDMFGMNTVNDSLRIIYGGSVAFSNVSDFIRSEHIDGVLVGSASVQEESFLGLLENI